MFYAGWEDLNYWMYGSIAKATITEVPAEWSFSDSVSLRYTFEDPATGKRTERDAATRGLKNDPRTLVVGRVIEVEFIPGAVGWSRIPGGIGKFLFFFIYVFAFLAIIGVLFVIDRKSIAKERMEAETNSD